MIIISHLTQFASHVTSVFNFNKQTQVIITGAAATSHFISLPETQIPPPSCFQPAPEPRTHPPQVSGPLDAWADRYIERRLFHIDKQVQKYSKAATNTKE